MEPGRFGMPFYWTARVVLGAATRVYFRSIRVRHRDRVPERGPVLVVANHPASFTDVMVLAIAIPRRLHFLAMAPIFKPWIRGFALRLCGTLPVYRRQDDPSQMQRNDDTFRACHAFLDRGGAVLIFPEGTSLEDRRVVPIKTGAARIALGQEARPGQAGRLTLLPVGLHFAERTGFWTDVVVSVGSPVDLSSYRTGDGADNAEVVRDLTARIQQSLEELILKLDVDRAGLVHAIEEIYRAEFATGDDGLDRTRNLAQCVEHFARSDPDRVQRAWLRIRRYHERLKKLHIRDQTVRELLPSEGRVFERARLVVLGLLGVIPALIGGAIHYLPYRACAIIGRTSDPTRVAAFRIGLAVVVFPLAYGLLAYLLWRLGWSGLRIAIVLGVLAVLGLHALVYFNWLSRQGQRIRLLLFKISNRRLVARLRHERRSIVRMCETAMGEYREIIGPKVRS